MNPNDSTSILASVRQKLEDCRGTWVEVSRASGVPYHTLTKIAQGQVPDPRISTVQRLVDYFGSPPAPTPAPEAIAKAA